MRSSETKTPAESDSMIGVGRKVLNVKDVVVVNIIFTRERGLFQCKECGYQSSLTAGTLFHGSKIQLRKWFLLIYLMIRLGERAESHHTPILCEVWEFSDNLGNETKNQERVSPPQECPALKRTGRCLSPDLRGYHSLLNNYGGSLLGNFPYQDLLIYP